ncbi:hypothetical protein Tco_0001904 [Tanacetum coccineum]
MRTRNSNFPNNSTVTIPRRRNRGRAPNIVEPELRTIVEVAPMAERTMEELLRAPTEGYGEAIVLPEINADHFEIKTNLLQLVQASPFHGFERENPHAHINSFKRITSTLRFRDVPNDVIKLMMFPYSLEGAAKVWYEKEPPNSILTWEDLDSFGEVLRLKKSNHFSSGSTTPLSDSRPCLVSFETSDSLLEEFADELALLDPFPPGNEDVDFKADLREIELLLNRDPSTNFSPKITLDPNPERFTDKPALVYLPPPGDDESFLKEDVQEENFQVYSNPFIEFDDNYNSSDINPLFKEILEDVKRKDSNVSNFDEPVLLNTPLFDEDECFDPGGEIDKIDAFRDDYNDYEGDVLKILNNTTYNLFPEVFFDHEPQGLKDEPDNDDLMTEDKVFDPGVMEKIFSPSYVRLSSKDRHYLFFTIVFSFGSEDTIFDPGIITYILYSYKPDLQTFSKHN